jgi:hypothetical protein
LPAAATAVTASSWRKFGRATITTSVEGCRIAASMSVVRSGIDHRSLNALALASLREYTTWTRSRPRCPWSVIV